MGFRCGIVGLPNVGKSTLFNALTSAGAAAAENYPFCTIEPNFGQVPVPDPRLAQISSIAKSAKTVPTFLSFVDIAGLVRGAAKGEGLGNRFLSHIREVDAVVHVLRCFEDGQVTHVSGHVDPVDDAVTVETELMLADMESLENRLPKLQRNARGNDREALASIALIEKILPYLKDGTPARKVSLSSDEQPRFAGLQLLTGKPILYVANVGEEDAVEGNAHSAAVAKLAAEAGAEAVTISARIEAELRELGSDEERQVFLEDLGLTETGLDRIVASGYRLLGLDTYFTAGPKETRAWTIPHGATALYSAGVIHSDFQRGFIAAETIAFDDYIACNGEQGAKDAGKMRQEGRDYIVRDGDVLLFRFNV